MSFEPDLDATPIVDDYYEADDAAWDDSVPAGGPDLQSTPAAPLPAPTAPSAGKRKVAPAPKAAANTGDIEAEKAVLATLIQEPRKFMTAADDLDAEMFSHPTHAEIFLAMLEAASTITSVDAEPFDIPALAGVLRRKGIAALTNTPTGETGVAYLYTLHGFPTVNNYDLYVRNVQEASARRAVMVSAAELFNKAADPSQGIDDAIIPLLNDMQEAISTTTFNKRSILTFDDAFEGFIESIVTPSKVVPTGFPELDEGFFPGGFDEARLITIGARPGVGKTVIALNLCRNAAKAGKDALYVSLEMSPNQVMRRLISMEQQITQKRFMDIHKNPLTEQEMLYVQSIRAKLRNELNMTLSPKNPVRTNSFGGSLSFWGGLNASVDNIVLKAREYRAAGMLDLLVIDYLQLMTMSTNVPRHVAVAEVTRRLKEEICLTLGVPVIILSQLNRGSANENRPATLSDLRESGAIEQDSDIVMLLSVPENEDPSTGEKVLDRSVLDIDIAKWRDGASGRTRLNMLPEYGLLVSRGPASFSASSHAPSNSAAAWGDDPWSADSTDAY